MVEATEDVLQGSTNLESSCKEVVCVGMIIILIYVIVTVVLIVVIVHDDCRVDANDGGGEWKGAVECDTSGVG